MPTIQIELSVPANTRIDNIFSGSAYEWAQRNRMVSVGVTGSATGLLATLQNGADVVLEESPVAIKASFPVIPDEMYYTDVAAAGDRLKLAIRNSTAGPLTVRAIAQIQDLP